jgi:hypothetical protein
LNGLARPIPDRHAEEVQRIVARIIPVIFTTGYSEYPVSTESGGNPMGNHRAIMKPFRPRDLLSTVREVGQSGASGGLSVRSSAPEFSDCVLPL